MNKSDPTAAELRYIATQAGRSLDDIEDLGRLKDVSPGHLVQEAPLPEVRSVNELIEAVGADADPARYDDVVAAYRLVTAAQEFATEGLLRRGSVIEFLRVRDEALAWARRSGFSERWLCVRVEATHRAGSEVTWLAFIGGKLEAKRGASRSGRPGMHPAVVIFLRPETNDGRTHALLRAAGARQGASGWTIPVEDVTRRNREAARTPGLFD